MAIARSLSPRHIGRTNEIEKVRIVILESIGIGVGAAVVAVGAAAAGLEWQYRQRDGNRLSLSQGTWTRDIDQPNHYRLVGEMEFRNLTRKLEIMVPEVTATVKLLSDGSLDGIQTTATVTPCHPDESARPDGYWFAYIVKIGKTTRIKVTVDIHGADLSGLKICWVQVAYVTYGPEGRIPKTEHVVIPLQFPDPMASNNWRSTDVGQVLPIKTHLLTPLDSPVEVVRRYVLPHAKPGDVVTIGESPIAIMQGRWRHPSTIKPGWVAKRICYYFLPTSSLATACGLQSLVDVVGPWRVLFAFVGGAIARVFGYRGMFYQLAGEQARLIDDVTGTLPPYDQFIVLGPENSQQVVDEIQRETGLAAAIVDVNDLRAVKVLAASRGVSQRFLEQSLIANPAGNANEQTPVVLLRPSS